MLLAIIMIAGFKKCSVDKLYYMCKPVYVVFVTFMIKALCRLKNGSGVNFVSYKQYEKDASQTPGKHNGAYFSG